MSHGDMGMFQKVGNSQVKENHLALASSKESSLGEIQCEVDDDLLFDIKGIVQLEFVSENKTVIQQFCLKMIKRLRRTYARKRSGLGNSGRWLLHKWQSYRAEGSQCSLVFGLNEDDYLGPHGLFDKFASDFFLYLPRKGS